MTNEKSPSEPISEERLRNTLAWATARLGQLSGAEVIVGAITELLERRVEVEKYKAWAASCGEPTADARDAERYRYLRADHGYEPEECGVRGGEDLDELCDAGIRESAANREAKP